MTTITVYRGGWLPLDPDDAANRIDLYGCIFAHEDRHIAAEYGSVGEITIDASRYLDARDPSEWRKIGRSAWKAKDLGYAGVIYPDEHEEWSTDGAEVAIFDPDSIIF